MKGELRRQYISRNLIPRWIVVSMMLIILLLNASQIQASYLTQASQAVASDWEIETVDSGIEVGVYASLALDQNNHPHIAYIDGGNDPNSTMDDSLSYAYKDSQGWHPQSVPLNLSNDEYAYGETSIALDQEGYPHISFQHFDIYEYSPVKYGWFLAYAYQDSSGWNVDENIDQVSIFLHNSLALADGGPRIAYFSNNDYHLHYAYTESGLWHTEIADNEGGVGSYCALALDNDGNPYVAYARDKSSADDLIFTYQDETGWHPDTVDSSGDAGKWASLALDSNNYAHISYCNDTKADSLYLKYIYQDTAGWHDETVDNSGSVGKYTSISLDEHGFAHISYSDDEKQDLKYAYQDNTGWHIETIDNAGMVGKYSSLALDSLGGIHIAYYDETNGALKYAHLPASVNLLFLPLIIKN